MKKKYILVITLLFVLILITNIFSLNEPWVNNIKDDRKTVLFVAMGSYEIENATLFSWTFANLFPKYKVETIYFNYYTRLNVSYGELIDFINKINKINADYIVLVGYGTTKQLSSLIDRKFFYIFYDNINTSSLISGIDNIGIVITYDFSNLISKLYDQMIYINKFYIVFDPSMPCSFSRALWFKKNLSSFAKVETIKVENLKDMNLPQTKDTVAIFFISRFYSEKFKTIYDSEYLFKKFNIYNNNIPTIIHDYLLLKYDHIIRITANYKEIAIILDKMIYGVINENKNSLAIFVVPKK